MNTTLKAAIGGLSAIGIISSTLAPAIAVTLLNGGLVPIAGTPTTQELNAGGTSPNNSTTIPDWTVRGSYNWLYADGLNATSNTTGSKLWGYGQSVSSPTGSGWFIALDGDQGFPGSIEQTLTGMITGRTYSVNFWQAAAQQHKQSGTGFFGATTERWEVSLADSDAAKLSNLMIPTNITSEGGIHAAGVTPWEQQTMYFTYTGTTGSALLKFLAKGTPSDGTAPPFSLLAGISATEVAVPEPIEVVGTLLGVGACFVLRSRLKQKK
jgi:hypothetical protein